MATERSERTSEGCYTAWAAPKTALAMWDRPKSQGIKEEGGRRGRGRIDEEEEDREQEERRRREEAT